MHAALRVHDDLLRDAFESHGGRVFKTMGDSFCVAFEHAPQALRAAIAAQRALSAADFGAVDDLHVRMALHLGHAQERDGDYFGATLNRTARLLSTAHGGQIVTSAATAEALKDELRDDVSLVALGTYRLKDLQRPERVYQVTAPGLKSTFKPLRTLDAVANNLPLQTTPFLGREQDVRAIRALLREARLVTITGTGGVGKTRLALQSLAEVIDGWDSGAWFVNLAPITQPQLVAGTILRALGQDAGAADPTQALIAYLRDKEILLLLDNCEHLIEQAARIVDAILERCKHVTFVATSREPLRIHDEAVYRLSPLERSSAVELFVHRARLALPGFSQDENAGVVAEICKHLDGIPLAIELAAARVALLSLPELCARLSERFDVLKGGSRTALPRQQTLQALIDWSYNLLNASEKALFRRLCVFHGSFSLEAASVVCADEMLAQPEILDILTSLVDKSLVVAEVAQTQPRYFLLESIYQYAWEKLAQTATMPASAARFTMLTMLREYARDRLTEAGEAVSLADRHARYFARKTADAYAQWDLRPSSAPYAALEADLENIRAALAWSVEGSADTGVPAGLCGSAGPLFLNLSLLGEGIDWCELVIERAAGAPRASLARVHYVLSMLANNQVSYPLALRAAQAALDLYRSTDDERGTIRALSQVAQQLSRAGEYAQAKTVAQEALARARAANDVHLLAGVIRRCAFALPPSEIELARAQFSEGVQLLASIGAQSEVGQLLEWWAEAEAAAGCYARAFDLGEQALERTQDAVTRMHRTSNVAGYALAMGDVERGKPFIAEALRLATTFAHALCSAIAIAYTAAVRAADDPRQSALLFGYAGAQMENAGWSGISSDERAREFVASDLRSRLGVEEADRLFAQGRYLSAEQVLGALNISERPASAAASP